MRECLAAPDPMPPLETAMAMPSRARFRSSSEAGFPFASSIIAGMLATLAEATHIVMCYEGARFHQQRYEEHGARLADLAEMVRMGTGDSGDLGMTKLVDTSMRADRESLRSCTSQRRDCRAGGDRTRAGGVRFDR